eukprot:TRINITY_DN267_c0_g1_i3.p1 TRINITY_DN267_c0_g1~~TRINITY_DN267_c0_g1_i3.p1  ORF type:complete len:336 (-),score=113.55 TRINITY_DN267_c0_g1_i3:424-1431(-)
MTYYRDMYLQRRVEIMCDEIYKKKEVRGFCHLMDGQEAVSVGVEAGITKEDHIITAYRCHGIALGRGVSVYKLMSEMMGRSTGISKGKGGSMHMTLRKNKYYGGNGIVGAHVPVGTGVAFGIKYEKKKEVCVIMYGDGAANQGQVFEAANMAMLWKLPAVYICENNGFAMGTSCERSTANTKYYTKLTPVPGFKSTGMCVFAVREAMKFARDWCLQGKGPICLEVDTYRYHGHSMSDAGTTYRTREEVTKIRKERDPIEAVKHIVLSNKVASESELKDIEKEIRQHVEEETNKARESPWPDPEKDLMTNVMATQSSKDFIRGVEYEQSHFPKSSC